MSPFLTVYTPTYKRQTLLEDCKQSVSWQTDGDVEHVIVEDTQGIGIAGVFRQVRKNVDQVHGQYVYFLQDDDVLASLDFVKELKRFVNAFKHPEVVIGRIQVGIRTLPLMWEGEPLEGMIDLGNAVVRSDIWKKHADLYGQRYNGDWDFIHGLWELKYRFEWWNFVMGRKQVVGHGLSEAQLIDMEML